MAKKTKLETYGPRSRPLVRNPSMTDAAWDSAKRDFDATMRRMGKKTPWALSVPACPQCGAVGVALGAVSGLCLEGNNCSGKAGASFVASVRRRR